MSEWRDDVKALYDLTNALKASLAQVEDTLRRLEAKLEELESVDEETQIQCIPEALALFEELGCDISQPIYLKDFLVKWNAWLFFTNQVSSDSTIHLREDVRELLKVPKGITYMELLGSIVSLFALQN